MAGPGRRFQSPPPGELAKSSLNTTAIIKSAADTILVASYKMMVAAPETNGNNPFLEMSDTEDN